MYGFGPIYLMSKFFFFNEAHLFNEVGSMVEWLKRRTDDQHDLGSKPTLLGGFGKQF